MTVQISSGSSSVLSAFVTDGTSSCSRIDVTDSFRYGGHWGQVSDFSSVPRPYPTGHSRTCRRRRRVPCSLPRGVACDSLGASWVYTGRYRSRNRRESGYRIGTPV